MAPEYIGLAAFAAAIGTFLGAVVNGLFQRRRLGADATRIITEAAGGVVADVRKDNAELRERLRNAEARIDEQERMEDELRDSLRDHVEWDRTVANVLAEHGITDIPPPPPLFPPRKANPAEGV